MEKQVVFPAPLGPKSPTASPRLTDTLTPFTTVRRAKAFLKYVALSPVAEAALCSEENTMVK